MQGTLGLVALFSCCWVLHGMYDVQAGWCGGLFLVWYDGLYIRDSLLVTGTSSGVRELSLLGFRHIGLGSGGDSWLVSLWLFRILLRDCLLQFFVLVLPICYCVPWLVPSRVTLMGFQVF